MRLLQDDFTKDGFQFHKVERIDDFAIYEKTMKYPLSGKTVTSWEVVKIRRHNGYTIKGVTCPPSEYYPSHKEWGLFGWTALYLDHAKKILQARISELTA